VSAGALRLFLGLPVPPRQARALEVWTREHADPAWRPVPAANLHVTLVFVGAAPSDAVPALGAALRDAMESVPAVDVQPVAARRFGSVLALPLLDATGAVPAPLADAQARLARTVERVEERAWTPHATVGRGSRRARPPLPDASPPALVIRLDEAVLYVSERGGRGVTYRPLAVVPLKTDDLRTDANGSGESAAPRHPHGRDRGRGGASDHGGRPQEGDA